MNDNVVQGGFVRARPVEDGPPKDLVDMVERFIGDMKLDMPDGVLILGYGRPKDPGKDPGRTWMRVKGLSHIETMGLISEALISLSANSHGE